MSRKSFEVTLENVRAIRKEIEDWKDINHLDVSECNGKSFFEALEKGAKDLAKDNTLVSVFSVNKEDRRVGSTK